MSHATSSEQLLLADNAALRARVAELEDTLRAIHAGEVDALVVESSAGSQIFTLQSADAESNRFRGGILGKVNDAVVAVDDEQRVIYINATAEAQYGVNASEALGLPLTELYQTRWLDVGDEAAMVTALRETGGWRGEQIHINHSGEALHVEVSVSRMAGADGTPNGLLGIIRDITMRKNAEEAVRAGEHRFRELIDALPAAVYTTDAEGRLTHFNPACVELSGRVPELGNDKWCVSWKLYNADGTPLPHDKCPMAIALKEGRIVRGVEAVAERPNGTRVWFTPYPTPLRDATGRIVGGINMLVDITERKAADEAMARLAAIVQSSDDAIVSKNLDGLIKSWNAGAERIFGYTAAEMLGRHVTAFIPEERLAEEENIISHMRRGERVEHFETVRRRKDGTLVDVSLTISPIVDSAGRVVGASKIARDITERKRTDAALRASEALFFSLIDQAPAGVYVIDNKFRVQQVNAHARPVFAAAEPVIGRDFSEVIQILWGPELGARISEIFRHTLATGERYVSSQFTEQRQDIGVEQSYEWETQRVIVPGGEYGVVCYFTDVTEQRALENALVTQAAELARADRSKDEFLAMLAHELRNPLAPLRNASEILKGANSSTDDSLQAQGIIDRQIDNMSRMIDDLLDVSRISEGKIELRKKPVPLDGILTAAASLVSSTCAQHSQELKVSLPSEPIFLEADATRIEQIIGNLLNNACKYSGDGSLIELSAERATGVEPPEVVIRVKDDGVGIDPELLPRIFELFVQASRTLDRAHGGLGIGLTLVQRLVKLHGGSVEARSGGIGHGAEFIVRLPVLREPSTIPAAPAKSAAPEAPRRILIVDDNADSSRSLAILQNRRGHSTRIASTGPAGLKAAEEFLPEVMLLDIGLPGMDGFEVARKIRANPVLAGTFLIAMSGYGRPEDRAEAKLAGFDEYMVKPLDLSQLREWIAKR